MEKVKNTPRQLFQQLKKLRLYTSEEGLSRILPLVDQIIKLRVLFVGVSSLALSYVSCLSRLQRCDIQFDIKWEVDAAAQVAQAQSFVSGRDLLLIAGSCPELRFITIGEEGKGPTEDSISDPIIEQVSRLLPHLQEV